MTNIKAEDNNPPVLEIKPFVYYEVTQKGPKTLHFYISEPLGDPDKYIEMIHRLKTAGPADLIYIYLNTPGGQLSTGIQLISAMNNSPAHIITVLEGEVCSLGTMLFLSGDEFMVNDHCLFMIHNYSSGPVGKGHELKAAVSALETEFTKMVKSIYSPFLSDAEINRVIQGEDIWMGSDEVRKRIANMIKIMNREMRAEEKAERLQAKKKG